MISAGESPRRAEIAGVSGLLAAALLIRVTRLDHFSLWLDEILESYWIHGSWQFFWSSLRFDAVHPPLDYLIARFADRLGTGAALRRAPDVLWGTISLAACWGLLRLRCGRAVAFLSLALLAAAPFHVRYSQEYRPHVLGLAAVTVALLALELFLRRPSPARLLLLFAGCLATEYALYLGAVILGVAGLSLLADDALGASEEERRRLARRCLLWSPVFAFLLWVAYLPWWPVLRESARRVAPVAAEPLTWARLRGELSFFSTGAFEGDPLRISGITLVLLAAAGLAAALRRPGARFLAGWLVGGFACVELLARLHPHFYAPRRLLCAAPALVALAAVGGVAILRRGVVGKLVAIVLVGTVLAGMAGGLRRYFTVGRRDWRPLAAFLRKAPPDELVFTENQWTQLCLAYYLDGPEWLYRQLGVKDGQPYGRPVLNLDGEVRRLQWSWKPGTAAWVVLGGAPEHEELRRWTGQFPGRDFPEAEGRARLVLLDPAKRATALGP